MGSRKEAFRGRPTWRVKNTGGGVTHHSYYVLAHCDGFLSLVLRPREISVTTPHVAGGSPRLGLLSLSPSYPDPNCGADDGADDQR